MAVPNRESIRNHAAFIWSVADLLRGDYKQSEYGRVILPFVVLRRLDCVLEPTKEAVVQRASALAGRVANVDPLLRQVTGEQFYNTSPLTMHRVLDDPNNVADNLLAYTRSFSSGARDVLKKFDLPGQVAGSTRRGCSIWSRRSSARSTCIPTRCPTWRWATSTRS